MAPAKNYEVLHQDLHDMEQAEETGLLDEKILVPSDASGSASSLFRRWPLILSHLLCALCGAFIVLLFHPDVQALMKASQVGNAIIPTTAATKIVDGVEWEGTQCGDSWEEAKAMGCHFDVMASRWYSPECFDEEALQEMLLEPQVNYTWFADPDHTSQLDPGTAMAGEFEKIYPLYDFHIGHCLYLWRKLHRAVLHNRPLDDELFSYGHTVHCTRLILRWKEPWSTVTYQTSGRPFCRHNRLGYIGP